LAEGQQKEKNETVLRLKTMGLSIEQIAQGTGLTVDEVTTILS
jgi:predicted transposase YdaD